MHPLEDQIHQKKITRNKIRQIRDNMSPEDIEEKSRIIQYKLWQFIHKHSFRSVMFYIAFGSEVRTQECMRRSIEKGIDTIVPLCCKGRQLLPCKILDMDIELELNHYGILEPKPQFKRPYPPSEIDLIIVPGLAFDKKGYRIGYSGGYYDRFLGKCPQTATVSLAYELQIVDSAFPAEWDLPVQRIITEYRLIVCQ
ncbi:5-formyltetrahydrofolate cyclo-ligase [Candidatus Poribacteria bacterium]|nr:5-formyltetrahydrofolate cyclo-ligase [Candidatus Poribacteria bacterium]